MQGQARPAEPATGQCDAGQFHRRVVCDEAGQSAIGNPLQQFFIAPIQTDGLCVQGPRIGLAPHLQQQFAESGVQTNHVATGDLDSIRIHYLHQIVIANRFARKRMMCGEVNHHATPLCAMLRQHLHAELLRHRIGVTQRCRRLRVLMAGADVLAGAKAVVEHCLVNAITVRIKAAAHVGEAVPLR